MSHMKKLGWLIFVATFAAPQALAGSVSGQFTLDGKAFKPTEVAAFRLRDHGSAREYNTYVVLSTKAMDKAKIVGALDPYTVALNDPAVSENDYVSLWVYKDGGVSVSANIRAEIGHTQYGSFSGKMGLVPGDLTVTCKENTPTHVACTVKTLHEVKPKGHVYTLDFTFDAEALERKHGTPIAAGGAAPGQAFLALYGALAGNDLGKILALVAPDKAKDYNRDYKTPAENLKWAKEELLGMRLPGQPKITGGESLAADRALLEVEGLWNGVIRKLFLVDMRRVDGKWVWLDIDSVGNVD